MLQRSAPIPEACIEDTNMANRSVVKKDDKRQWLLKKVKKVLRNRWFFRVVMVVWRIYDHFDR